MRTEKFRIRPDDEEMNRVTRDVCTDPVSVALTHSSCRSDEDDDDHTEEEEEEEEEEPAVSRNQINFMS